MTTGVPPTHTLPFSVNHYLCPPAVTAIDFFEQIATAGFNGVGLTQSVLQTLPTSDLNSTLQRLDLGISSLNTCGFFLHDGEQAVAQDEQNQWFLQQARALGKKLNVIVGGSSTMALSDAREQAFVRLQLLAEQALELDVALMVEPLHHLNVRSKSCFNSISQLVPIFDRIPNLTLNADLFHLWWDPDLERLLRGELLPVGLLQICDVSLTAEHPAPRRAPLDEGSIPWRSYVRLARENFPDVPIELELFADQLPGRELSELLASSVTALSSLNGEIE